MKKLSILFSVVFLFLASCSSDNSTASEESSDEQFTQAPQKVEGPVQERPTEIEAEKGQETPNFADFFAKNFVGKSETGVLNGITAAIHQPTGVYMVHTAGANPVIASYQTVEEMQEMLPQLGSILADINCELSEETFPEVNQTGQFEKKGCFVEEVENISPISDKYIEIADLLLLSYEQSELDEAKTADDKITHVVLLTDAGVKMGFAAIEGEWKLLLIDLYSFEMGV